MAIDWNKEITFTGRKGKKAAASSAYPEKTYMNLMPSAKQSADMKANIPAIIIVVLLVGLFIKFGVLDFYGRVDAKQAELATQQQTLNAISARLADYDAVVEEYESYASIDVTTEGLKVDALDALALVDRYVSPSARVTSISLSGDTLALSVTDISLDGVGKLASTLLDQDMVADVAVSTAATQEAASEDVTAALTITLVQTAD